MKILLMGADSKEAAAALATLGFSTESRLHAACRLMVYDLLKEKHGYAYFEECLQDYNRHWKEWEKIIREYNFHDRLALIKDSLETHDVVYGYSFDVLDLKLIRQERVFDLIVGMYSTGESMVGWVLRASCDLLLPYKHHTEIEGRVYTVFSKMVEFDEPSDLIEFIPESDGPDS